MIARWLIGAVGLTLAGFGSWGVYCSLYWRMPHGAPEFYPDLAGIVFFGFVMLIGAGVVTGALAW